MTRSNTFNFGWKSTLMWVILTVIGCAFGLVLWEARFVPRYEYGSLSEIGRVVLQLSSISGVGAIFQWFIIRRITSHAWAWPVLTFAAWVTGCIGFGFGLLPEILTSTDAVFFSLVAAWAGALQWLILRGIFSGGAWWISLSGVGGGAGWVIGQTLADLVSIRMVGSGVFAGFGYVLGFEIATRFARGLLAGFGYGLGLGIATGLALAFFLKTRPDPAIAGLFSAG